MVEFFDFQCPACRRLSYTLDTILTRSITRVRIVHRHFPLGTLHPRAHELAIAGECAGKLGQFEPFYRKVFDNQRAIARGEMEVIGLLPATVDTAQFRRCLVDPATSASVATDIAVGNELGIRGTPTLVINGRLYVGARSVAALDTLIATVHR
jgi:protein-disulfide isomerase